MDRALAHAAATYCRHRSAARGDPAKRKKPPSETPDGFL
jgi:hypothetical protein